MSRPNIIEAGRRRVIVGFVGAY